MSDTRSLRCQCLKRAVKALSRDTIDEGIRDVERRFLSEYDLVRDRLPPSSPSSSSSPPPDPVRKSASEPKNYSVDYDELCGPWPAPDHPTYRRYDVGDEDAGVILRPTLCTWTFVEVDDLRQMRENLFDGNAIKGVIEQKLPNDSVIFQGRGREIFLCLAWDIFKFMRDNLFTGKGVSAILGLFYLTHRFFLSTPWRTAHETYAFFQDGLELHAFLKPPESDMIFNFAECDKLLEMFRRLYVQRLELVRAVCQPGYDLSLKLNRCDKAAYDKLMLELRDSEEIAAAFL